MSPRHGIFFLVLLPFLAVSSQPQTSSASNKPAATIKTEVRRVLVDVVVTGNKGEAVTGLKQEDFIVLEDGKAQTISSFEEHHGAPITQVQMPPLPPHVYTNFPAVQAADSVNVILLDALNTPARDQYYVRKQMIKYLKTIPPGTRVAVFTLASRLRMLQGVTTDSSELLAALNGSPAQQSPLLASDAENDANNQRINFLQQEDMGGPPKNLAEAAVDPVQAAKQFLADVAAFQTEQRISLTLDAMQQLARYLASVPGRKNVIWFSGSFPTAIFGDPDLPDPFNIATSFREEIRKTTDLLSAAQLALYPIAAEGLSSDSIYQANGAEISQKKPSFIAQDQIKQMRAGETGRDLNHVAMEDLAKDTGGQAFYNTNGLSDALTRVVNNGTRYYTLTYPPSNQTMDGRFRHIQIKLNNGKYSLSYRRGYFADDLQAVLTAGVKPDTDPLLMLMGRNLPDYSQILFKVLVQPVNPQPPADAPHIGSNPDLKDPITRYGADFAISLRDLTLEPTTEGGRHGSIEIVLLAYDREGKPLNFAVTQGDVNLSAKDYATIVKAGGLQIHKEIDVPKGYIFLRAGIYDFKSSAAGTLGIPLNDDVTTAAK